MVGFERKINILFVITKLELGGAQKQLLSLLRGLDKEKFNPYLVSAQDGLLTDEAAMIPGLKLVRCRFLERPINPAQDIFALFFLYFFIKNNSIDIVHTHSSKAGILGRLAAGLAGIKAVVHTVHGWSFHGYQNRIAYLFYLFLEKFCAFFTGRIIVVSRSDKDKGLSHRVGSRDKYALVRYAINTGEFKNSSAVHDARKKFNLPDGGPVIGMVACLKEQKSPLDFIKLAASVKKDFPGAKFILAGDGVLRKRVCSLMKKLKLEDDVILAGWRNDIPLFLSALDVFVLTSRWEGMPIAVLEALAAGVPSVVTDTGGIAEVIVDGRTGYLVKVGDIPAMRNRVGDLLRDPRSRDALSGLSRASVSTEDFSLAKMLKDTEDIYSVLRRGRSDA